MCNVLIAMAVLLHEYIYKHIYFWKKATFAAVCVALALPWCCVQKLPAVVLDSRLCRLRAFSVLSQISTREIQ